MIRGPAFPVEPWAVRETEFQLNRLAQIESVFALANGHIGLRANLDEGEPFGVPGTYLNGFYEARPLPYAEAGYGFPEDGQTIVNVTNGKIIRLLVEDEPFDIRYGDLRRHERVLDLRAGVLRRTAEWESPTGRLVKVSSTRLVSFTQRAAAAIQYEVEPVKEEFSVVIQSNLVANESLPPMAADPRAAAALAAPLQSEFADGRDLRAALVHITKASGNRMGAAMDHVIDGPDGFSTAVETFAGHRASDDRGRHRPRPAAAGGQVPRLWLVGGALQPRDPRSGRRGAGGGQAHRLGRAGPEAARLPRQILGAGGRRARGRCRAPAGAPLRPVPRPPGRRARRAARDSGQGPDGPRLRRAHVLGHRELCAARAHLHPAPRRRRRAAVAPPHARARSRSGEAARPEGGRVSLAHDPR